MSLSSLRKLITCLLLLVPGVSRSQVIISLLLGDELNSGKVEFGLDGGVSFISQGSTGGSRPTFNLGFYFDIKLKGPWMFHTGVIVKSTMGAGDLPVYSLGDAQLDSQFANGHVDRSMSYFNVPFMIKYNTRSHLYVEAGPQLGLLYNAQDQFITVVNGHDLTYNVDVRDKYRTLDAGMTFGVGYRLLGGNGMNVGIRYYLGLMNVAKDGSTPEVLNRSLYLAVGIPIGAGKAKAKKEE